MRRDEQLDFSGIRTWSARERVNIVKIEDLKNPGVDPVPQWYCPEFDALVERIVKARKNGRPVVLSMGAHVIKNWLSRYLIALMRAGIITHIAGNGACSIHDFELAYQGVVDAVKNGTISEERINDSLRRIYRIKYADKLEIVQ